MVLDPAAYRYSLNVGGIARFPASSNGANGGGGTNGANQILRASRAAAAAAKEDVAGSSGAEAVLAIDPSRASVSSTGSSRASTSRLSSRYTTEEVAPQRRPVYLALPSDPSALGPWSNTSSSTLLPKPTDKDTSPTKRKADGKSAEPGRRNSKIMTTFPFPHPVTPRRRAGDSGAGDAFGGPTSRAGLGAAWQRLLTTLFAGPYERRLNREELQDDLITQSIIADIARRNTSFPPTTTTTLKPSTYGTIPIPPKPADPHDPYGYRQLAGPHLLPTYTTDLVARRRERRRARSRARFQCMASWTIWTVSVVWVLIVVVLVFSFVFPDRLDIPNRSDDAVAEGLRVAEGWIDKVGGKSWLSF
ncbi:hypothetical protein [Sporisorium scitamineum]|nr:hypothetical protein [Sporisorium scitamineum]